MFIRTVDDGLENMLRAQLPLPPDLGDVSFDPPGGTWAAQLSRLTVNLFLYEVVPSGKPVQTAMRRVDSDGKAQRRRPQPAVELNYLVSAWAGSPRDEHQLLGDIISRFAGQPALAEEYFPVTPTSTVHLEFGTDDRNRLRDIWSAAGGHVKASFSLTVTAAADSFGWTDEPPKVTTIEGLTRPTAIP